MKGVIYGNAQILELTVQILGDSMFLKFAYFIVFTVTAAPVLQSSASPRSQQEDQSQKQKANPAPAIPADPKKPDRTTAKDDVQILSDTMGIDFGPYLERMVSQVKEHWYQLIPESLTKKGKVAIEFAILKDGKIVGLKIQASSGDVTLDRPAFGAISSSNPFSPLPKEFSGQYLLLRFKFYYNPGKNSDEPVQSK